MCGPWAVMWIFCWKHCLEGSIESFEFGYYSPSFFYISTISVLQQSNLKLSYNLLKIYFDQTVDTTLPDITEKIKLPIYFSQVTSLLNISLVLPATNAVSEESTITLRRIKNWLRTSMTQRRLNHRMLLDIDKEMTDKLSLIEVGANEFCFGSDERSRLFSHFCQNQLPF